VGEAGDGNGEGRKKRKAKKGSLTTSSTLGKERKRSNDFLFLKEKGNWNMQVLSRKIRATKEALEKKEGALLVASGSLF